MGKKAEKKLIFTVYPHSIKKKNKETVNNSVKETKCKTIFLIIQFLEAHFRFLILK